MLCDSFNLQTLCSGETKQLVRTALDHLAIEAIAKQVLGKYILYYKRLE